MVPMEGVLQCKQEEYCDANGKSTESISLSSELTAPKALQKKKLDMYCYANWRCPGPKQTMTENKIPIFEPDFPHWILGLSRGRKKKNKLNFCDRKWPV